MSEIELRDWLTIAAIIIGPILAVQVQRFLEGVRDRRNRRLAVFHTLMATRAARLSHRHVQALNMIDIEDGQMDSYFAGTINARSPGSVLLQVRSDVTNASASDQPFRLLDVAIRADDGYLAGASGGSIAFAKNEAGWESVRKQKPEMIPPGKTYPYTHVFGVSKSGRSWMLTYKGKDVVELKGKEKWSP